MSQFTVTKIRRHLALIKNNFSPPPICVSGSISCVTCKIFIEAKMFVTNVIDYNVYSQYAFPVKSWFIRQLKEKK